MSERLNREVFGLRYRYYTIASLKRALEAAEVSYPLIASHDKEQLFELLRVLEENIDDDNLRQTLSVAIRKHYNAGKKIQTRSRDLASAFAKARGLDVSQDEVEDEVHDANDVRQKDREPSTGEPRQKSRRIENPLPELDCEICMETKHPSEFIKQPITESCRHESLTICLNCVARDIRAKIEMGQWRSLQCPLCPETLSEEDVEHFADKQTYTWYVLVP